MTTLSTTHRDLENSTDSVGNPICRTFRQAVSAIRLRLGRAGQAHARLAADISAADVSDAGLDRETILGHPDYEDDLPFFLQRRFCQR